MKYTFLCMIAVISLICGMPAGAETTAAYDLVFKNGTLDPLNKGETLIYQRSVKNTLKPETEARDTGEIILKLEEKDSAKLAFITFRQGDKSRGLGRFPASVGNPMIMYFYETVIRDMAESAGGSPYYIRNRIKDALVKPADIEHSEVILNGQSHSAKIVRYFPFANDPNRERMQGFADLELRITMTDEVIGWYADLSAYAGDSYQTNLIFSKVEKEQ